MSARPALPAIVAAGAVTALARGCLASTMLARATRLAPRTAQLRDRRGQLIAAGRVPDVPVDLHGAKRLAALAVPALGEALEAAGEAAGEAPMPIFVALPEVQRPDMTPLAGGVVLDALAEAGGARIDRAACDAIAVGRAGFAEAVSRAIAWLSSRGAAAAIVGAVDSFWHPRLLRALRREGRLAAGLVPSEAAAFLVIAPRCAPGVSIVRAAAVLAPPRGPVASAAPASARATSPGRIPSIAPGLTEIVSPETALGALVRDAVAGLDEPLRWLLTDSNGEADRAEEWARVARDTGLSAAREERLCERCGDVGSAAGALACAFAWTRFRTGSAPSPTVLVALASEGGPGGCVLLHCDAALPVAPRRTRSVWPTCRMAEAARDVLETARDVPRGRSAAALRRALDEAWHALGRVEHDDTIDAAHLARIEEAILRLRDVLTLSPGDGASDVPRLAAAAERTLLRARGAAIDHLSTKAPAPPRSPAAAREFIAGDGAPPLHEVAILAQPFAAMPGADDLGEEESANSDGETTAAPGVSDAASTNDAASAKDAASENETTPETPAPEPPGAWRRAALRTCFEAMARLSLLREPQPNDPPGTAASFERRLLLHLDAVAALARANGDGEAIDLCSEVSAFAAEAVRDGSRAFVRAFVLGCLESDEAARLATLWLSRSEPVTHPAQARALALASSPHLRSAMERLCRSADPALVSVALDVLAGRGEATPATVALLVHHPSREVQLRAARALAGAREPAAAVALCARLARDASDPEVAGALAASLTSLRRAAGG